MSVSIDDLGVFAAVMRAGSFTRAAAQLGISQPAVSRIVRGLETRLGARLLNRTTRSLAPTRSGAALLADLAPALDTIDAAITRLLAAGDAPAGSIRLTAERHGYDLVLAPMLASFLAAYPLISVEVSLADAFVDAVKLGFDGGLRLADLVERDMVALRVGPDLAFAVVGSPRLLAGGPLPATPGDIAAHPCIAYRQPRTGGLHAWRFEKNGRRLSVQPQGRLVLDDGPAILGAALAGAGLAYLFLDQVADHLAAGRLVRVLADWCPPLPGYRLYYPERRQQTPAVTALIQHIKTFETSP